MLIIYFILVSLALSFPEVGHEAGPTYIQDVYLEKNAMISANALSPSVSLEIPGIMRKIATCESNDRHFDKDGKVVIGKYDIRDIGRYQINLRYWEDEAKKLGYDIYSEDGNEAFAMYLYKKYGTDPWQRSRWCWSRL
ncbi:hypothetical protein A3I27_01260 [Candidatus Giovannonibacteria bacterium RIFCSPLOWO2_02_FULL_43_11b]|uniref:Transglycosylase SLT domain-containing protein n=1 Tax=Candidatus Giovannonibacteria bacterium RIFCSPHIGHO2_12_FULL_43_15 TaxID=1798341 RepID=A0A1F5WPT8_9BACT|nr:MAG: hypothetical protein A3B97_04075 [Candidatus Giovannonibacteria bacterium RIFCSPHIGHO2_02_FULL_43_32]OGF77665.1 MAG: hypothetical protein A3F23_03790 [Candidatus Giovannonibacteria bacterium RIFCSPHIGHO2_12_FULL_43_15]OGF78338.1 MAG: hypothetical protein A3A15_00515 [Candidatus Giovannonibacteria bacterium RIFCSPLOWO2_01_FULL_43_60]OGF90212.1 MAG: hypothetical protein A3I27_01260 [Candidatus Giovannonibacteria bacterium RIFCSPLOWO2_02_FULL_43_11b]OGF92123.1 MAG: hypothetical protein A3H